jgi:antitoxin (DNA-binding transcriptional repressor) of toxin-antitoxin stability system
MKRFTVADARARFGDVLDAAEQGKDVVIERRGVRFTVQAGTRSKPAVRRRSLIAGLDPALEAGDWGWTWTRQGVQFRRKPRRR